MSSRAEMLHAIDLVLADYVNLQKTTPERVLELVITALNRIKLQVEREWPLSQEQVANINLGPFAAKNISDWNGPLADSLMRLHAQLTRGF